MEQSPKYYIVEASALPEIFQKVAEAKRMLETGETDKVNVAAQAVGISRSAFYKYRDSIAPFQNLMAGRIITFQMMLKDKAGVLSEILAIFANCGANILTINQSIPTGGRAMVTISAETSNLSCTLEALTQKIAERKGVVKADCVAGYTMHAFQYSGPTEIVFGAGSVSKLPELLKKRKLSRVLVVYGGSSARKSGLLDRVFQLLEEAGVSYQTLGGVQPNPRVALAREGVKLALSFGAELILAVGGGSVIDTCKAIAHGAANPETDLWEFWKKRAVLTRSMPVGVVLTIPAAGSETSDSAVLTNAESGEKRGLNTDLNRPVFAILDPVLAATLPNHQVACGVSDILMHTMDRYFNPVTDNDLTDELAEALLRVVLRNGPAAVQDPHDETAMSEIMWAGSLSHNGLTGLGGNKDFAPHQLGHALSEKFDVYHGESLTAIWSSWARYVLDTDVSRFARFARNVWGVEAADDKEAALAGIAAQEAFFRSIGMPVRIPALSCGRQDEAGLADLASRCSYGRTRTIGTFRVLGYDDILAIYQLANNEE